MIEFYRIYDVDNELYEFCLRQKGYYQLENIVITKEVLREDMNIPEGYDKKKHYCQKVYIDHQMTAYIDYQCGYRYSMQHDDTYVWIGLFLVDENKHRQGFGKAIIQSFINQLDNHYNHVQLACIEYNEKGMAFWKSLGFYKIADSHFGEIPVVVFQLDL